MQETKDIGYDAFHIYERGRGLQCVSIIFIYNHPFLLFIVTHIDFPLEKHHFLTLSLCEPSIADITHHSVASRVVT